jgi:hypothetical protein
MKRLYGLTLSDKALRRIWREQGLLKRKRRKHRTKNDLRAMKAQWRLFEQICMDTKDLVDIPELYPQIRLHRLPTVQYTAREVVSGLQFIAFAEERALAYATLFLQILIEHLHCCGATLQGCRIQTDNGAEFVGSWNAKDTSAFTRAVESVPGLMHHTIPPSAHRWQADIETVHRLIEDEFYEVESFTSQAHFLSKATSYILWFNTDRQNSYKHYRTPWQIVHERDPNIHPRIACLPPVFLDKLLSSLINSNCTNHPPPRGYHLIPLP